MLLSPFQGFVRLWHVNPGLRGWPAPLAPPRAKYGRPSRPDNHVQHVGRDHAIIISVSSRTPSCRIKRPFLGKSVSCRRVQLTGVGHHHLGTETRPACAHRLHPPEHLQFGAVSLSFRPQFARLYRQPSCALVCASGRPPMLVDTENLAVPKSSGVRQTCPLAPSIGA